MIKKIQNHPAIQGSLYAIGATAIWSVNFILARGLNESIPPISLAFWRWTVAVLVFLPFALKPLIAEWNIIKKHVPYLCITAFLGITLFNTLVYYAGHTTTAVNLSLISITFPIFIIILSLIFLGESVTINKGFGIILVVAGVLLLITKGNLSSLLKISFAIGDLWMLLAAITFAVYSILIKHKPTNLSIWTFQLSTFILGLIFLAPFFIWETMTISPVLFTSKTVFAILYVGIFAALVAFVLWNKAIVTIGPSRAGMIYYTLPVFSGISAYIFLNESISMVHFSSILLILSGILIANFESKKALNEDIKGLPVEDLM